MSNVARRAEYSLYVLGYASEMLLAVTETYWRIASPREACPSKANQLVADVRQAADNLYECFGEDWLRDISNDISDVIRAAWSHFQEAWSGPLHTYVADFLSRVSEHELIPEEW